VRVEVKHGTKPHGQQVIAYEEHDGDGFPSVPVVILAPIADLPFDDVFEAPVTAPQRSWQSLGRLVKEFESESDLNSKERWLVQQFVMFLKEERLMPIERMTDEEMQSLAVTTRALVALKELVDGTQKWIEQHWTTQNGCGGKGVGSFVTFPTKQSDQSGIWTGEPWFEFKVSDALDLPVTDDEDVHFIAGLSGRTEHAPVLTFEQSGQLSEAGFSVFKEGGCDRVMLIATPRSLLDAESTLEHQIEALGRWAVDSFETLARILSSAE
jgi:hypothetical protein